MSKSTIRRALPADAESLAELGARTFSETFGHLYPPEDLAAFLAQTHTPALAAGDLGDPDKAVWVAESDGRLIGYALAGPCALPHPEANAASGEVKRIYVLAEAQGEGLGQRLIDEALTWLEDRRRLPVWLGVWSGNHAAQRFYLRRGFRKVGAYGFHVGATVDHEFIFRRD